MADRTARLDTDAWRRAVRIVRSLGAITEVYRLEVLTIRPVIPLRVQLPQLLRRCRRDRRSAALAEFVQPEALVVERTGGERRDRDPDLRSRGSVRTAC